MAQDWTHNAMLAERNRLAKLLNQRIVRLERAGVEYGAIEKYKDWISEYYGTSKTGLLRFPEKRTAKTAESWNVNVSLRRELDILSYFSNAEWQTATVGGVRALEKKRLQQFAAMGLKFPSVAVMNEFLKSESWKALKKIYGSAMAVRLAGMRNFRKGTKKRKSTVEAMENRLQRFLKRMGTNYDLRNMDADEIARIFGLDSEDILEAIEEDDLP